MAATGAAQKPVSCRASIGLVGGCAGPVAVSHGGSGDIMRTRFRLEVVEQEFAEAYAMDVSLPTTVSTDTSSVVNLFESAYFSGKFRVFSFHLCGRIVHRRHESG
jgi:hypothetical protein